MAQEARVDLKQSVLQALSTVTDPELDEPITDLGFVKELSVSNDGRVSLDLVTSKETRPSFDTESSLTKPRSVIGSSSSGSVTVESAWRTLCLRSTRASWAIVHLERLGSTTERGAVPSSPPRPRGSSLAEGGVSS